MSQRLSTATQRMRPFRPGFNALASHRTNNRQRANVIRTRSEITRSANLNSLLTLRRAMCMIHHALEA